MTYRSALDAMSDAIYLTNDKGLVTYANRAMLDLFEIEESILLKNKLANIDSEYKDFELLGLEDQKVLASKQPQENFYDFRSKSSYKIDQARTSKSPIFDDKGNVIGISAHITPIGENYISSNLLARGVKHYQNIQQLTLSISKLNSEQAILWELAQECARLLSLSDCVIYIYNENDQQLAQKAAYGAKGKGRVVLSPISLKVGEGIVGKCAQLKKTILVDDLTKDKDYVEDAYVALSEISVPILFQDKVIGVIDSESPEFGFYNIKHKDFLEAIAAIAALKISELRNLKDVSEKEQYLKQILESPKDLMAYSIDNEFCYRSFNKNHARIIKDDFNVDIEIGMNVLDFVDDEAEREEYRMSFEMALKGSDFAVLEKYRNKKDGSISYLDKFYSPLYSIDGEIIGVTAFIRDITDEKMVSLKLEERERLIQTINENIKDGIFRYSVSRGFLYSNSALLDLFGVEPPGEKVVDLQNFHVFKHMHLKIYNEILQNGSVENKEVHFKKTDGTTFWGLLDCTLTVDGEEQLIDGVITNITILKEMSQNLIKTNSEMDQLVYRTSHDLRAPIASLLGLESLLDVRVKDEEQRELLGIMKGQLKQLDSIILDIITYRKVAKLGLTKDVISIEEMINNILKGMQFMENYDHVEKTIKIDATSEFVNDKHNLQVIFNNLLSNAIKYSKKEENGFINIVVDIDEEKLVIVIEDNGIGIEKGYLSRVFNMFYRATNYATGTGLGLFIVKEAVTKLEGNIKVDSKEGEGSTFVVSIPNLIQVD
ncbi:MAG: PAS domain S-box protein [Reichenbachiella sp.]|uniref:ATP-binding protein n=1 Tax=Reichenbachiella sp. TaxID=2184521 RepID=UPI002965D166|nr:ATP-binding protein [Reichenbachiella sp.]MDW3210763.1 PAS domain S-box protein [Reichenbachiella sp.]